MNIREKVRVDSEDEHKYVNTHGLEGCPPPGLFYRYIDSESEAIIKHVIITNLEILADDFTL
jgi:hypothetical protein